MVVFHLVACAPSGKSRIVKVVKGPFDIKIHATGQLQSAASFYVGCPSVERVWRYTISFMAPEGKPVNEGDPILAFDSREILQRLQLKQAKELDTAMKELERIRLQERQTQEDFVLQEEEAKVNAQKAKQKVDVPENFMAENEYQKLKMDFELAQLQEKLAVSRVENQNSGMKTRIHVQASKVGTLKDEVGRLERDIKKMNCTAPKPGLVVYAPDWNGKKKAVGDTPSGISGLETALGLSLRLVHEEILKLNQLVEKMALNPARILRIDKGTLKAGQDADIAVIDINKGYIVVSERFASKGKNTPFAGWVLKGMPVLTICKGRIYEW